jgi:dTDP-glucose 4,6-dehydratase
MKTILITGGAGFIGSHVVRLFVSKYPDYKIVNLDKLTYAGNLNNLKDVENKTNYEFVKGDIVDNEFIQKLFEEKKFDGVIHLAAESHVDRSISNPTEFVFTNVIGTVNLLNSAKHIWKDNFSDKRFYHISTDEVYGDMNEHNENNHTASENDQLKASSYYSATKAASDMLVLSANRTYGLPYLITRTCNNFGEHQYEEKFLPTIARSINEGKPIPVYGDGLQGRE